VSEDCRSRVLGVTLEVNSDVYLIEACAMVSVAVVVISQLASDLMQALLDPRVGLGALAQKGRS
jgi:ABC-type dipeptide/oligopeptide/nickel transport system permease component